MGTERRTPLSLFQFGCRPSERHPRPVETWLPPCPRMGYPWSKVDYNSVGKGGPPATRPLLRRKNVEQWNDPEGIEERDATASNENYFAIGHLWAIDFHFHRAHRRTIFLDLSTDFVLQALDGVCRAAISSSYSTLLARRFRFFGVIHPKLSQSDGILPRRKIASITQCDQHRACDISKQSILFLSIPPGLGLRGLRCVGY